MQENEQELTQDTGVSEGGSPDSQEPAEDTGKPVADTQGADSSKEKYVPYERFQEVIQQKNDFLKRFEESDRRYAELQRQFEESRRPVQAPQVNPLVAKLKGLGVDAEFVSWIEKQESRDKELAELREWRTQSERSGRQDAANRSIEQLHTENKVPKELHDLYRAMIRDRAAANPNLKADALPQVYKEVHDTISKLMQAKERATAASYVTSKKADAGTPPAQTGPAPKQVPGKPKFSSDREEARQQIVDRVVKLAAQHTGSQ